MRIDLHTHSDVSDGTDRPAELIRHAARSGLDVVAITDHDTTRGWDEADAAASETGVALVPGIEVSCTFAGHGVHLLAYLPDPDYPPLVEELQRVLDGRSARLPALLERLHELGIEVSADDVRAVAGATAAMGRPHVADALVAKGLVENRTQAFDTLLGPGGPAYVRRYAADLETMIGIVSSAGGVTVIAHPWANRHNHRALDEAGFARLERAGLSGIEVDHPDHGPQTRAALRALAADLDLVVTGSSDYHGTRKIGIEMGCNTTGPQAYERLLELADAAAARAGRGARYSPT